MSRKNMLGTDTQSTPKQGHPNGACTGVLGEGTGSGSGDHEVGQRGKREDWDQKGEEEGKEQRARAMTSRAFLFRALGYG